MTKIKLIRGTTHSVILSHNRKVVLHKPCESSMEAAQVCTALRECVVEGADVEITITNDPELVDHILKMRDEVNPLVR